MAMEDIRCLDVTIGTTAGLKDNRLTTKQDPYAVVRLGEQEHVSHKKQPGTRPVWNHRFSFVLPKPSSSGSPPVLEVLVFEGPPKDRQIGYCELALAEVMEKGSVDIVQPVFRKSGKLLGHLRFHLMVVTYAVAAGGGVRDLTKSTSKMATKSPASAVGKMGQHLSSSSELSHPSPPSLSFSNRPKPQMPMAEADGGRLAGSTMSRDAAGPTPAGMDVRKRKIVGSQDRSGVQLSSQSPGSHLTFIGLGPSLSTSSRSAVDLEVNLGPLGKSHIMVFGGKMGQPGNPAGGQERGSGVVDEQLVRKTPCVHTPDYIDLPQFSQEGSSHVVPSQPTRNLVQEVGFGGDQQESGARTACPAASQQRASAPFARNYQHFMFEPFNTAYMSRLEHGASSQRVLLDGSCDDVSQHEFQAQASPKRAKMLRHFTQGIGDGHFT